MRTVPHHKHAPNVYASGPLDRADRIRGDQDALSAAMASKTARLLPVWRGNNLVQMGTVMRGWTLQASRTDLITQSTLSVFLGLDATGTPHFAIDLSDLEEPPEIEADTVFEDLRKVGPMLGDDDGAVLAYARGLVHWHRRHLFCGVCGSPTESRKGGHERRCTNENCGASHFPRTDPAVIMLVHDGADRIVLGRQKEWPPGRCSVLAGFVEPGESLEDAVAREVMEEVGLPTADIRDNSSQPWPFPSSIMLGFSARATAEEMTVATDEIEEARWVTRAEIAASPEDETFALPRRDSIAYRLIQDWMAEG
ncbi:MAG: NAD(+) diphosphatase [Alphaproteobacteria bacterium]|nr:NAD(+) diphosphatase [Alphaproteobacteria bacterium]